MLGKRLGPALSLAAMVLYQGLQSEAGRSVDQQTVGGRTMRDGGSELMGAESATMAQGAGGMAGASVRKGTGASKSTSVLSSKMRAAAKKRNMIIGIAITAAIVLLIVIVVGVLLYRKYKAPKPKSGDGSSDPKDKNKPTDGEEKKPKSDETIDGKERVKSGKRTGKSKDGVTKTGSQPSGGSKDGGPKEGIPKVTGPTSDSTPTITVTKDMKGKGKMFDVPSRDPDVMVEFWLPGAANPTPGLPGSPDEIKAAIKAVIDFIINLGGPGSKQDVVQFLEQVKSRNPKVHERIKGQDMEDIQEWLQTLQKNVQKVDMPASSGIEAAQTCLAPAAKEGARIGIEDALRALHLPVDSITLEQANSLDRRYLIDNAQLKKNIAYITEKCHQTEYRSESDKAADLIEFDHMKNSVQLSAGKMRLVDGVLKEVPAEKMTAMKSCGEEHMKEAKEDLDEKLQFNETRLGMLQVVYGLPTEAGDGKVNVGPSAMRDLVSLCHTDVSIVRQAQDYVYTYARNEAFSRVLEAVGNISTFDTTLTQMRQNEHFGKKAIKESLMADGDELAGWVSRREFARGKGEGKGHDSD